MKTCKNHGPRCAHIHPQKGNSHSKVPRRQDRSPKGLTQGYPEELITHEKKVRALKPGKFLWWWVLDQGCERDQGMKIRVPWQPCWKALVLIGAGAPAAHLDLP